MQALSSASPGANPAETHLMHSSILEWNQHRVWLSKQFCPNLVAVSSRLIVLSLNLKMLHVEVLQTKYQTPTFYTKFIALQ